MSAWKFSYSLVATLQYLTLPIIPLLYLLTMARTLVLGDPTEYTLVANVLGIAHPPGYAFITLAGKLFQTLIPFGSIPWRMHLLSVFGATLAAFFIYRTVKTVHGTNNGVTAGTIAALFSALTAATGTDVWQHAIHANPHIITAAFLMANLFILTRWWASHRDALSEGPQDRWLYAFALSAGLGITHHPLTVFSFPAYAIFILIVRPPIWRQGRTILKMVAFGLLGLSVWLYFPIRSAMEPVFGPHTMNTLDGFLNHVLARGLTESLPFYRLAEQPMRALVFWTLLRLQYGLTTILLSLVGLLWFWRSQNRQRRPLFLLYGLTFLCNYAFVVSLRAQDIMAYLLGPFLLLGMLAGIGFLALWQWLRQRYIDRRPAAIVLAAIFLLGPVVQVARNAPRISLRHYDEGRAYVEAVFAYFEGKGEGAVLLHDWEHMTPLWYERFVQGRWPDPADVTPEFVSTQRPWVESVFDYLGGGPVYLSGYRNEIVAAGFRLRPRGPFYQVVEPADTSVPPELTRVSGQAGEIEVVGYQLPQEPVTAGDFVSFTLAMRASAVPAHYYVPSVQLGTGETAIEYTFTTDSHLLTPLWQPGEVIIERFDFALPHNLSAGRYPLTLHVKNLSTNRLTPLALSLGTLDVHGQEDPPSTAHLLANFRQRVGLAGAVAWSKASIRRGPWQTPLQVQPGDTVNLVLQWESLALAEESYTVFVHLIDAANRPHVWLDYTPLGGSAPTHLWIPKWLPGQRLFDPYQVHIGDNLAPGTYYIEVGLYEMTSQRRLHISDQHGNLEGDRLILGPILVEQ